MSYKAHVASLLLLVLVLAPSQADKQHQQPRQKITVATGSTDLPASQRGLTEVQGLSCATLVQAGRQYSEDVVARQFRGPVLGYVTPWHTAGHEFAVRWRGKFSHISPVWYQLRTDKEGALVLVGGHEAKQQQQWLQRLREPVGEEKEKSETEMCQLDDAGESKGTCGGTAAAAAGGAGRRGPLIVPRVVLELDVKGLSLLLGRPGPAIERLVQEVEEVGYDGLVLEAWGTWAAMGAMRHDDFREAALGFIRQLAANLKDKDKVLVLAAPPVIPAPGRGGTAADPQHLLAVLPEVAGVSLMTYDYGGTPGAPGPNAPLSWMEDSIQALKVTAGDKWPSLRHKVWAGLNFYGTDYTRAAEGSNPPPGAQPVLADAFLAACAKRQPKVKWDKKGQEHFIKWKEGPVKHTTFFPTPASMALRVSSAAEAEVGLSIWELGQGMESFFDLL